MEEVATIRGIPIAPLASLFGIIGLSLETMAAAGRRSLTRVFT